MPGTKLMIGRLSPESAKMLGKRKTLPLLRGAAMRGLASAGRTKAEKEALIMRMRQREEETKKYGAPLGQV